ncbi:SDR family oxidoreductase [Bacillaceae bacterium Marseille-Q3522]|nr:SDR family oxidoreductase [Bacillaceae bacterium Marseille-Q3522]
MKKNILITGASGGIGGAIARKLAGEGYSLYLHYYKNQTAIEVLLEQLRPFDGEYLPIQADLTTIAGYQKVCKHIFQVDGIIHNCGLSHYGVFQDMTEEEIQRLSMIHVISPMLLTKTLLPKMLNSGGSIIMISSIWGQTGAACEVAYSTMKGAQLAFVKALAKEVARNKITVNAIAPGAVNTKMMATFQTAEIAAIKEEIPIGRLAEPTDIANCVSFLLSNKASYITGQTIAINGGWYV